MLQDLRHSLRLLAKNPSFSLVAVLTLTLGIGATTAITSVLFSLLLGALPFRDAGRLAALLEMSPQAGVVEVAYPDFVDWRAQAHSFAGLAAYSFRGYKDTALVVAGEPQEVRATLISSQLLPLLGIAPRLGRGFLPAEDEAGRGQVALLSDRLWRSRFLADPRVVGRPVRLNGQTFTVVGVLPPGRQFPFDTELFLPFSLLSAADRGNRMYHTVGVVGRLRSGVSAAAARAEMATIAKRLAIGYPATNRNLEVSVVPLREQLIGHLRAAVLALGAAVTLVLLIACANVANLLLIRAGARERELAVRAALGAGRGRLLRQLVTESLVLCGLGAVLGTALAAAALPLLQGELNRFAGDPLAGRGPVEISLPVLALTIFITVLAGTLFGVLPARSGSGADLHATLRQGGRGSTGRRGVVRSLLAAGEMALAVVLLLGAALLIRSFANLVQVDPGFRTGHVLSLQIALPENVYSEDGQVLLFYQRLLARLEQLPGVTAAAATNARPLATSHSLTRFLIAGAAAPPPGSYPVAQIRSVSPSYFRTLGIAIVAGRAFEAHDLGDVAPVAMVNRAFARRYLAGRDALAGKLLMGVVGPHPRAVPIVGVAADARDLAVERAPEPEIYFPGYDNAMTVLVRGAMEPAALVPWVRQAVLALDRNQPVYDVESMDAALSESLARPRLLAGVLGLFAFLALGLAALGIYGVLAYAVAQRRREIGIRMALGARRTDILRMVLLQGCVLILAGEAAGLAGGLALGRLMQSLLFQVRAGDPAATAGSLALLALVALLAVAAPAWRAARTDPMEPLRSE